MSATGFANAPVTKGFMAVTTLATLSASATRSYPSWVLSAEGVVLRRELWRLVSSNFVFSSAGELVLGLCLLYVFRQFERQWGSRRFGSFLAIAGCLSTALSLACLHSGRLRPLRELAGGPYGVVFGLMVQYYWDIPVSAPVASLLGARVSDKTLVYLAGAHLLLSTHPASTLPGAAGMAAGVLYRWEALGLRRVALPPFLASACARLLGPLLGADQRPPGQIGGARDAPWRRAAGGGGGGGARAAAGTQGYRDTLVEPVGAGGGARHRHAPAAAPRDDSAALATLAGMGFTDAARNQALLDRAGGDVNRVLDQLLG